MRAQELEGLLEGFRGRLKANEPLAPIVWLRAGGPADLLAMPADADDLAFLLKALPEEVPVTVIGLGSNLLIRDGGIEGVVVRLSGKGLGKIEVDGDLIRVGTALPDKLFAKAALDAGLGGFAFYHGIPGGLGGALRMNAGANAGETCDRLIEVVALDRQGNRHVLTQAEMGYSYRHSDAPKDLIFVEALFRGEKRPEDEIRAEMDAVQKHREEAQPIKTRTGGSTFKNLPGQRAWELIDAAGCRGLKIGGARVSEMHCNFLINEDDASAYDLELLGETVRARVLAHSGVRLDWEVRRLGRFGETGKVEPFLGA
ncbi:UDP-N-acetylmuramate dehydrogenase [Afifella sp. YEN Y35]|uniref:UDP-N-acetylmuramate dehydrogenase n=1 Tax=Afifella sp. YEN Y35 TaxID=3388337 RepID=UPI0039E1E6B7